MTVNSCSCAEYAEDTLGTRCGHVRNTLWIHLECAMDTLGIFCGQVRNTMWTCWGYAQGYCRLQKITYVEIA
ncbi:hypothetical protein POVCU2_0001430 [Plasmodium ovale curtisi]|uniref:Uncharacterized protein n=1 Tax=Plasmodium ovale curtisi TaxID=864141 RepID=A0A1A8VK32_PLAOA|nr:hypothetical protein POVCU2_0001430 [Plasmodium ovale curtisi]